MMEDSQDRLGSRRAIHVRKVEERLRCMMPIRFCGQCDAYDTPDGRVLYVRCGAGCGARRIDLQGPSTLAGSPRPYRGGAGNMGQPLDGRPSR